MNKQAIARRTSGEWTAADEGRQPKESFSTLPGAMQSYIENPVENIVVPTDFSAADNQLLHRTVALGQLFDAKITLLHVIDINDPGWLSYCGSATNFMSQLKAEAERKMNELLIWFANQAVEIKSLIVEGLPYEEILKLLSGSSLLIIRKSAAKPFWRLFSEKTDQCVLDRAQCALMVCTN